MNLLLASKSPRRHQLLRQMELSFTAVEIDCDEELDVPAEDLAKGLAIKKSRSYGEIRAGDVLLTADTTVLLDEMVLNKPENREEAIEMLKALQGRIHVVSTGVCLRSADKEIAFDVRTEVHFRNLEAREIQQYVDRYQPMDKAGAYGIQEWIGLIGVTGIRGCYYNVMGLPCPRLYEEINTHFPQLLT